MSITSNAVNSSGRPMNQSGTAKTGSRPATSLNNYAQSSHVRQLTEGQVIKGEITDLRNNEVTVTLEDNTYVTGHLDNGSQLSIGDTAAFKVTSLSNGRVQLEALPKSESVIENSTINKALEEAGLPKNEKNQAIVRELINQQMPISKQSITFILRQSYANKDISIRTLILMNKHQIPITPENAVQFEQYRNNEHRLVKEIASLADTLPQLFNDLATESDMYQAVEFGQKLLSVLTDTSPDYSATKEHSVLFSTPDDAGRLVDILETFSLSDQLKEQLLNGTAPLRDTASAILSGMDKAAILDANHMEEAALSADISAEDLTEPLDIPKVMDLFDEPFIESILKDYKNMQWTNGELAAYMSREERNMFLKTLAPLPLNNVFREKIADGTISAREVIQILKNVIPLADTDSAAELFRSPGYHTILKESILSNWTLTPKTLAEEHSVDKMYQDLYRQTAQLNDLFQSAAGTVKESASLSQLPANIKNNVDFMQLLNEMFTYVQLPVKLKDHTIHSDLYVYTRKKQLIQNPENISVLLHLDMDYLGPLDIHLALNGNLVAAKFYFTDDDARELASNNIELLKTVLEEKGFLLNAELLQREKEIDIVKDFIEKDKPAVSLKRYTFDIRA